MKKDRSDSYDDVLKYTSIFGGVQGLNLLIGLVRNKIVALLLGPAGMGLVSLFNTSVNFLSQATNLGISFSAVRNVSELYDKGDEEQLTHYVGVVRAWTLLTALLGMVVCALLGPVLSNYTFDWGDHTLHFVLLAPAVGLMAITGGETAILKGARQLKALAVIQMYNVFIALLVAIPIYYFFGMSGIVPVIVLVALAAMVLTIRHSYRLFPLTLSRLWRRLSDGKDMIRLGVAFVFAGILGSGAEMFIRSYLNVEGGLDVVGFYNAGFMITVTYASMVFTSMETDFFPRLSAVCRQRVEMRKTVNRQIEVAILLASPMLCMLIVGMPFIIPLLFSSEFESVVEMAQVAVFSMYIKAISLPISYLTLARGDSFAFLLLEAVFDVVMVFFVAWGYHYWGLFGTGLALSSAYLVDILLVYLYAFFRYGYHVSYPVLQYVAMQLPLGIAAYVVTKVDNDFVYWTLSGIFCLVSLSISISILYQKTALWDALKTKLNKKLRGNND